MQRNRFIYIATAILTMVLGLLSRKYSFILPNLLTNYLGDTLWAIMIYQFIAILQPTKGIIQIALISLTFCYLIELSQLYHAPWIDAIRATTLGGLVLGFGFLWVDLAAYAIGVLLAFLTEKLVCRTTKIIQPILKK